MGDDTSVKVGVRIRPQIPRELIEMCHVCTTVTPGEPQVILGKDKAFTFDHVFDMATPQEDVYVKCIEPLIEGCFDGYNATVLAYGQTGSGKTYSMGTGFDINHSSVERGIIPRAVQHLFNGIAERQRTAKEAGEPVPEFKVNAQFMELYNEEINDLLNPTGDLDDKGKRMHIKIHEDSQGGIYTLGVTTRTVTSIEETLQCLKMGALSRTTGSTQMNTQSSRSHAIFTLHIKQQRIVKVENCDDNEKDAESEECPSEEPDTNEEGVLSEFETLTAKFHFVDLAGSERLKRTGATGDRAKEGISINCGLLALGNVISALGDKARRVSHVPYRDSKLTRLLQDSLGGNSRTLMIACVSPSDRDFMETLNTLKYANRAKNIKNRVKVNQDKSSQTITTLRREIQRLELELTEYKQGKRILGEDGSEQINDMFHENTMLQSENTNLRTRIKALQETVDRLNNKNTALLLERETQAWIKAGDGSKSDISEMIQGYIKEIEELRAKLMESEETCTLLRRQTSQRNQTRLTMSPTSAGSGAVSMSGVYDLPLEADRECVYELLQDAKKDVHRLKKKSRRLKESTKEAEDEEEQDKDESESKGDGDEEELNSVEDLEEDSSDSETDTKDLFPGDATEDFNPEEHYSADLAELTCEISIKERLISELEQSQRRLLTMRQHYENKLSQLHLKIRETESERDKVLTNMGTSIGNQSNEQVRKVKEAFEKKLSTLQGDVRKLQAAKREHAQLMKTQSNYERQLKQLKDEVLEMKKTKVRLVSKMKEESQRHREDVKRRTKEMDQMRKDSRYKETQLRKMEAEKRLKENILRRKTEEVNALRRLAKPMSDKVAGRVPLSKRMGASVIPTAIQQTPVSVPAATRRGHFSPKLAKQKWQNLEKNINKLVLNKQCIYNVERDMDRWLHEREKLSRCLEKISRKRDRAILDGKEEAALQDLEEQMEDLKANIDYIHENIAECQSSIGQIEDAKDDLDSIDLNSLLGSLHLEESKYLVQKLLSMAINQSFQVAQQETSVKELEAKLQQVLTSSSVQQQLIQHLLNQANEDSYSYAMANANQEDYGSVNSSRSVSPIDCSSQAADVQSISSMVASYSASTCPASGTLGRRDKARRKTATPEELLYHQKNLSSGAGEATASRSSINPLPDVSEAMMSASTPLETLERLLMPPPSQPPHVAPSSHASYNAPSLMTQSMSSQAAAAALLQDNNFHRVTSAPGSLREMAIKPKPECSPIFGRKAYADLSPAMRRKNYVPNPPSLASRQNSVETTASDLSPPNSPTNMRRTDNVFSRLTSGMKKTNKPDRGIITSYVGKSQPTSRSTPLVCTHIAEGHSKAVLSITATDDVLFSSSKDRTVKIWDLHTGREIQSLGGHPNNVSTVRYCEYTRLAFSVSGAFIKVWDARDNPAKCVKTLSSSGLTTNGQITLATPSRTSHMPPGESQINDIALNHYGTTLYSAAGNIVRIWDLRMFTNLGRLSGGHQAAVMCLAVDDIGMDNNLVVTGSKDHYIKVFEVLDGVGGIQTPKMNLEPPHYDGIQCLAISGDFLFSGSRDMCIKKWDLSSNYLVQSLNQAHKDWVCALSFLPSGNVLLSGCRGGFLKLWSSDSCQQLAEIKAHNAPINSISTNSSAVFTASNDNTISIWLLPNSHDASPEFSDFGDERF